ncbi:MAG: hypothetical protein ABR548_00995 [Actinomycetota bacterium]|nr:hypothetical protein [Actinomycetota bacterium]
MAAFVYNPANGAIPAYVIDYAGANAPHAAIEVNGTTLVNQVIPSTRVSGSHGGYQYATSPHLDPGTYYVVAFGFGPDDGIFQSINPSQWHVTFDYGIDCEPVNVPATIMNYNNSHFRGGTHIYASGVEVIQNSTVSFDVAERNVFGLIYNVARGASYGTYSTPTCGHCGYGGTPAKLVSSKGHYAFTKSLVVGAESAFDVDFLKLSLPAV